MSFSVIIPARFASTRLPGKPLLDIQGKPMIQHVYERAVQSKAEKVYIATDDIRIKDAARSFGAEAIMTSTDHLSGTDRLQEVVSTLGLSDDEVIVNVQGDEPLIPPAVINQVADALLSNPDDNMATLCEKIEDIQQVMNPNIVKVVFDRLSKAHYFSRAPIPWARDEFANANGKPESMPKGVPFFRHIGIYAYRVTLLNRFVQWQPSPLELVESLEQLRVLDYGENIVVKEACELIAGGVDTPEDLDRVRRILR